MVGRLDRRSLLVAAAIMLAARHARAMTEIAGSVQRPALRLGSGASRVRLRAAGRPGGRGPFRLLLEGLDARRDPAVNYSIFLNLPDGAPPDPAGPFYVGRLSFFGRVPGEGGTGGDPEHGERQAYDVTALVLAQQSAGRWPTGGPTVTLVPSGVILPGGGRDTAAPAADAGASIARIRLIAE